MNTNAGHVNGDEEVIDLRVLISSLWKKRWWIFLCVLFLTSVFAVAAYVVTPVYRSSVQLIPASIERTSGGSMGQLGGLAALAGISIGTDDAETEEALAVLRSRQFTENFIKDKGLMKVLFADAWDEANGRWRVTESDRPTSAKAFKFFDQNVRTIVRDNKTGLITLQIDWRNRIEAADWANELVRRINQEMRNRAITKVDASLGFLEKELKSTSVVGTQEAINRLIEAQIKQRMLANVSPEYAFRVVSAAMVADADDPVRPRKILLLVVGVVLGFAVGILLAFLASWFSVDGKK